VTADSWSTKFGSPSAHTLANPPDLHQGCWLLLKRRTDPTPSCWLPAAPISCRPEAARYVCGLPVVLAAPPMRHQEHLNSKASIHLPLGTRYFKYAQQPRQIEDQHGYYLSPPDDWIAVSGPEPRDA
jgi:hypothetical protein